jgi:hypothetical protein
MNKCIHSKYLENIEIPYCELYGNLCHLDEPDEKLCLQLYGDLIETSNTIDDLMDDPDDVEPIDEDLENIIDDEVGVEELGDYE